MVVGDFVVISLHNMLIFGGSRFDDARDLTRDLDANRFRLNRIRRQTTERARATSEAVRKVAQVGSPNLSSTFRAAEKYFWHVLRATRSRPSRASATEPT
jgi:hypothetical protein